MKVGLDDYLAAGGKFEDIRTVGPAEMPPPAKGKKERAKKDRDKDHSTDIDDIAVRAGLSLWHDASGESYASFKKNGRLENVRCPSKELRGFLYHAYKEATGETPSMQMLKEAAERAELRALHEGPEYPTALRVWGDGTASYLDLADAERNIVRIDAAGWRLVDPGEEVPVRFLRSGKMAPLPLPQPGGSLEQLREVVSLTDEDFVFAQAWLIGCLLHRGGLPILLVMGEQGSGKSYGSRILCSVIDPIQNYLRSLPKDASSLAAAIHSSYVLVFDNMSSVPVSMSDLLCSVSTGGGISQRRLYTDADEFSVPARAPMIFNGIGDFVSRNDLLDRTLPVHFKRIEGTGTRRLECDLDARFAEIHPGLLGALLDKISTGFRNLNGLVIEDELPRLADLGRWVTATEPEETRGSFLRLLAAVRAQQGADAVEGDPLASAREEIVRERGEVEDTATKLLFAVNGRRDFPSRSPGWPRDPKGMGTHLSRVAPALRRVGIGVEFRRTRAARLWRLWNMNQGTSPNDGGDTRDGRDGAIERERANRVIPSGPDSVVSDIDDGPLALPFGDIAPEHEDVSEWVEI